MFKLLEGKKKMFAIIIYIACFLSILILSIVIYNKHIDGINFYANLVAQTNDAFNESVFYGKLSAMYNIISAIVFVGFFIPEICYLFLLKKQYRKKLYIYSFLIIVINMLNVLVQVINPIIFAPWNFYALILVVAIVLIIVGIRQLKLEKNEIKR